MRPFSWAGITLIMFVGLKLTHNIAWSWWWVLSPLWVTAFLWVMLIMLEAADEARNARIQLTKRRE